MKGQRRMPPGREHSHLAGARSQARIGSIRIGPIALRCTHDARAIAGRSTVTRRVYQLNSL